MSMEQIRVEVLNAEQLAERWGVPVTWVNNHTRKDCLDRIPRVKLGKKIRFEWGGKELLEWWEKHKKR